MKKQLLLFTILFCLFTVSLSLITATYGLAAESYLWPVPSSTNISQNYSSSHKALDITGGGNIVATKSGTVVYVYSGCNNVNAASKKVSCSSSTCSPNTGNFYNNSTYGISTCNWGVGNGVVLKHTDGTYSSYSHMASVSVSVGDSVTQGAKLGVMGSSGCSTGTHLHFAISNSMSQSGTWCNFTDPVNNNPTNISYIYSTATPCTTHTKGQYMYYGDNHPHYNYYKCSVCGSIFADGSTHVVDSCLECHRPDKPVITGLSDIYYEGDTIVISWTTGANTTHCNYWLYKEDNGEWKLAHKIDYATSGVSEVLNAGKYQVKIVATNSNFWEADGSTWLWNPSQYSYFNVVKPCTTHTKGQYMYYGDNHPHYNYYKCSVCGSIFADGSTHVVDSCLECHRPDKPVITGLSDIYYEGDTIVISWTTGANTTHCNYWLYKEDNGEWKLAHKIDYATSGVSEVLNAGKYQVKIVATNSYFWEADGSTWLWNPSQYVTFMVSSNSYTISFNANGGSGAPESQTKEKSINLVLSNTRPTRLGYTFLGWATSNSATTAQYQPGDTYTTDADLTLYAVWEKALSISTQPTDFSGPIGSTITFTVSAVGDGLTYQWYYKKTGETSFTKSTLASGTKATYSMTLADRHDGWQYYCIVKDSHGNTVQSNTVMIHKVTELKITTQPVNYTGAAGTTMKLTVAAQGDGLTYQWYVKKTGETSFAKSTLSSATSATLSLTVQAKHDGYQYYCKVKDSHGNSANSNTVKITVATPLKITTQPTSYTGAAGSTAKLKVVAQGDGLTYQWYVKKTGETSFAKSTLSSATSATLSLTVQAKHDGYQYYCKVKDSHGSSVNSNTVKITVATPLKITTQPSDYSGAVGSTVKFTVKATGSGLTYQWYYRMGGRGTFTKSTLASGTKATYTMTLKEKHLGWQYYCIVTDAAGNSLRTNTVTIHLE